MKKTTQKECPKHGLTDYTLEGRGYYRCKKCRVDSVTRRRRKVKQQLADAFGGCCKVCKYNRCIDNLTFHHRDPTKKEFGIAECGVTRSYEKALKEALKCTLLCKNCHGEVHAGLISIPV